MELLCFRRRLGAFGVDGRCISTPLISFLRVHDTEDCADFHDNLTCQHRTAHFVWKDALPRQLACTFGHKTPSLRRRARRSKQLLLVSNYGNRVRLEALRTRHHCEPQYLRAPVPFFRVLRLHHPSLVLLFEPQLLLWRQVGKVGRPYFLRSVRVVGDCQLRSWRGRRRSCLGCLR